MINDADKKILDTTVVIKMQRSLRLKVKYLVSLV